MKNRTGHLLILAGLGLLSLLALLWWMQPRNWLEFIDVCKGYADAQAAHEQLLSRLALSQNRRAIKQQATEQLARQEITLERALREFEKANNLAPWTKQQPKPDTTGPDEVRNCQEVLAWVADHLKDCPAEQAALVKERLQREVSVLFGRETQALFPDTREPARSAPARVSRPGPGVPLPTKPHFLRPNLLFRS